MDSVSFGIGKLRCIAVRDGDVPYRATDYVANAPRKDVVAALARHGHRPDQIPSPYSGLIVETPGKIVLIDTGAGDAIPGAGNLNRNLAAAGVAVEDIGIVVLTHAHPDHIGGSAEDRRAVFPHARYTIWSDEWAWWTNETNLARLGPVFGDAVRKNLLPLRDRIDLIAREVEVAPGVHVLSTPGHTPGHVAVVVESAGEQLVYVSDAALHPIHLEHPDWHPVWDQDRDRAAASKRQLFDMAATAGSLVLAFHFPPFPSLGHVERHGTGWRWLPTAIESAVTQG